MKEKIKQHQIVSYFTLTYLATWVLILPYLLTGDEQTYGILVIVGIFCPALFNIFISRIIKPERDDRTRRKRQITFLVSWIIATLIFTWHVQSTSGIQTPVAIVFFAILGLFPAFVLASVFSKYPSIRESLSSILKPKGRIAWYLFALFIIPVIRFASIPLNALLGWEVISEPDLYDNIFQLFQMVTVTFLYSLVFTGGLNEETGWTGFALPRLQTRFSPLISSIILWFFWILWHMPMQIAGYWNPDMESFIRAIIGTFFARFIFTWLYNKTEGGILSAILFHVSANTCFMFLPVTHVHMILEVGLAILVIVIGKMWIRLPHDE